MDLQEERPAYVTFELKAVEDRAATIKNGHYTTKDVEMAMIQPPYSKDCVHKEVQAWLKENDDHVRQNRIPAKWRDGWKASYEAWKNGQELPVDGTPIKGWGVISPAQTANLLAIGIKTVEDLARVNDEGVRRIGMGAIDLKNRAQAWLKTADRAKTTQELAALKADNARQAEQIKQLADTVDQLKKLLPKQEREKQAA